MHSGPSRDPIVRLRGINKSFGRVRANLGIDFEVYPGEIVGLLGENGAGKTTLMNILFGLVQADQGEIELAGVSLGRHTPSEAIRAGVSMVHQHFMLIPSLTVAENLVLGHEPMAGMLLDLREAAAIVRRLAAAYGLDLEPDHLVSQLSVGQQQRLEILRALHYQARVLILDEPTAVLAPAEVDRLFAVMRQLAGDGLGIVLIAHKLDEVLRICDRVVVLRRGQVVGERARAGISPQELAQMMVGEALQAPVRRPVDAAPAAEPVLRIDHVTILGGDRVPRVRDVTLDVAPGEIVSIAGVDGNGQTELEQGVVGILPIHQGRLLLAGQDLTRADVASRRRAGLGYIPQDRRNAGLLMDFSVAENLLLGRQRLPRFSRAGMLQRREITMATAQEVAQFDIRCDSITAPARGLSGGNQQKVVLARAVAERPRLLLASQIGRGLDVGAVAAIYDRLWELRAQGTGILLISFDIDEVLALSDRIFVMRGGRLVAHLEVGTATRERIGDLMLAAV